ncbi:MAG: hypothetical protein U1E34_00870 [Amaricoccus sp.]
MTEFLPRPPIALLNSARLAVPVGPVSLACATAWIESYNRYVKHRHRVDEFNAAPWDEGGGLAPLQPWPVAAVKWLDDDTIEFWPFLESARRTEREAEVAAKHPWSLVLRVRGLGYKTADRLIDQSAVRWGYWIEPADRRRWDGSCWIAECHHDAARAFAEVFPPPAWKDTPEGRAAVAAGAAS